MRILIVGNSGSGKSTFANVLSGQHGIPHLDLDSIVWEPKQIAVLRSNSDIERELLLFTQTNPSWVVEGCYGELAKLLLGSCTELIFMNPGKDSCISNNQNRPWEPHKYSSESDQQRMLPNLRAWVADYYTRDDSWSYAFHRRLFDAFQGAKRELSCVPSA
jgi:adenylate kinase family enzyme